MHDRIFADHAPLYWAAGLPVIPIKCWNDPSKGAGKAPILSEWTQYGKTMVSTTMQDHWVHSYPDNNIGLPFGPASGLCAIDIDSEDDDVIEAILACLPKSPWKRVGKKGMGLIYKWNGQANFKIRDENNQSIVEFLGLGNQMILPPSIHPQTERPYVSDTNLWEVLDKVLPLPADIKKVLRDGLSGVMGERGLTLAHTGRSKPLQVVPQGERDIQLVRHAGYLARVVMGIDKNEKFTLAAAIEHMYHWVETYTASMSGDSMDPDKGVAKLLEFLLKDMENGKTLPDGWDLGLTTEQREHPSIASLFESNEVARWGITKARTWLSEQLKLKGGDDDWAMAKAIEIVELVGKDENFSDAEFGALYSELQTQLGKRVKLSKPDMRKLFKEARAGSRGESFADHEAIARFVIQEIERGGELRHALGTFWQWGGSCFARMDDSEVYLAVAQFVKGNTLARRHNDYAALVKTITHITKRDLVDDVVAGINFANGYLDTNGVLHEHSPKFGQTFTMAFDYVPARAGECHKWLDFLENCWGDDPDYGQKVAALQEAFAATMFGVGTRYQRALLLFGSAGAGKSQILDMLVAMMPPSAVCTIPPYLWKERFVMDGMVQKTLNICGELAEQRALEGQAFKQVVEGALTRAEYKGKDAFMFKPKCMHFFGSNHLPKTTDSSAGFMRRWLILEFNKVVPPDQRVPNFAEVLIEGEREAIAAWAVQGMLRLNKNNGYTIPSSHVARINQVLRGSNQVAAWLQSSEKVRPTESHQADALECFDQFSLHVKNVSRGYGISYERFLQIIGELGHEIVEYRDIVSDVVRYKLLGLKVITPTVESKWASEAGGNVHAIR